MTEGKMTIEQEIAKQTSVSKELVKTLENINSTLMEIRVELKEIKEVASRRNRRNKSSNKINTKHRLVRTFTSAH